MIASFGNSVMVVQAVSAVCVSGYQGACTLSGCQVSDACSYWAHALLPAARTPFLVTRSLPVVLSCVPLHLLGSPFRLPSLPDMKLGQQTR